LKALKLKNKNADIFIPDGSPPLSAIARTTHLCIGSHPDDLEIMAYAAIAECYESDENFFTGIVVSDGQGSVRSGKYTDFSSLEFSRIRQEEQKKAAEIGKYSAAVLLNYQSSDIKNCENLNLLNDLEKLILLTRPEVLLLHSPFDQHLSHIAVLKHSITVLKNILPQYKPRIILGCEVWGSLDWLPEKYKVAMNCEAYPELAKQLLKVFKSQIECGKQYDRAVLARRTANATFYNAYTEDKSSSLTFAADLSILLDNKDFSIKMYLSDVINLFGKEISARYN